MTCTERPQYIKYVLAVYSIDIAANFFAIPTTYGDIITEAGTMFSFHWSAPQPHQAVSWRWRTVCGLERYGNTARTPLAAVGHMTLVFR